LTAHFTDGQIALAIDRLDMRARKPDLSTLLTRVKNFRREQWNLKTLLGHSSKLDLAEELWPILERKLVRATSSACACLESSRSRARTTRGGSRAFAGCFSTPRQAASG
jgi:hypothetical protein